MFSRKKKNICEWTKYSNVLLITSTLWMSQLLRLLGWPWDILRGITAGIMYNSSESIYHNYKVLASMKLFKWAKLRADQLASFTAPQSRQYTMQERLKDSDATFESRPRDRKIRHTRRMIFLHLPAHSVIRRTVQPQQDDGRTLTCSLHKGMGEILASSFQWTVPLRL